MKNILTLELNTNLIPIFKGTYETIWEVCEYDQEGREELPVSYKHADLMESIASVYKKNEESILSDLNSPFIKKLTFNGKFTSPREYNFRTDELDFVMEIDKKALIKKLNELKGNTDFEKFLEDNYTSYDGFWSFTPNSWIGIEHEITSEGEKLDQAVSAVITFLARANIMHEGGCSIEYMVYEDWQGNGYGGLDYQTYDNWKEYDKAVYK